MSLHLEFQLDSNTTSHEQKFTLPKSITLEHVALKLNILNDPAGSLDLEIKRGVTVIETISLTSADINAAILAQLASFEVYKIGYFLFSPTFPINLRRNVEYTLSLSTTGYTFSNLSSFGWLKEYVNETNLLTDVPANDLGNSFSYRLHGLEEYGSFNMPRTAKFFDGQQSATTPELGSLNRQATGSEAVPLSITAVGGIPITDVPVEMIFVESDLVGEVDITANPQVQAGVTIGQELNIYGTDDFKTVLLEDGNGLNLNGAISLDSETNITLIWTGTVWKQSGSFGA